MFQDVLKPFHLQPLKNIKKTYIVEKNLSKYDEKKKRFFLKKWDKVSGFFSKLVITLVWVGFGIISDRSCCV